MSSQTTISSHDILHVFFPALLLGLVGLFMMALFAVVYGDAGGAGFFANTGYMSTFGFFVGFVGKLAMTFEKQV